MKIISCFFNIDTACVEVRFSDGSMLAIDTIAVEDEFEISLTQQVDVDYLIYNKPLEYAQLVLSGNLKNYIKSQIQHGLTN